MAALAKQAALMLMSTECYDTYFVDHEFFDVPCFKALLSKGLGLAIIAGSLLVKVPQVLKILQNKSGEGINIVSVCFDLLAITIHMSYSFVNGYPFSSWGDTTFLALQTAAIAFLVLFFQGAKGKAFAFILGYAAFVYALNSGLTPVYMLFTMQSCNIPIMLVGKLTQAHTNYSNSSTGQLSAITVVLMFAGSLARIFTSIQETGDRMMVVTFCISSLANGIILAQLIYYWNKPAKGKSAAKTQARKSKSKKVD